MVIIVQGILFQMWNATFATFFQEQFPMRIRVTGSPSRRTSAS